MTHTLHRCRIVNEKNNRNISFINGFSFGFEILMIYSLPYNAATATQINCYWKKKQKRAATMHITQTKIARLFLLQYQSNSSKVNCCSRRFYSDSIISAKVTIKKERKNELKQN